MRITTNQKDSEDSNLDGLSTDSAPTQKTYSTGNYNRLGRLVGELVPIVAIITLPLSVHAGVFSSLVDMLGSHTVVYERSTSSTSAIEVPLLSAITNSDPTGAHGGGDVIVDEGALISSGTLGEDDLADQKNFHGEISVYTVREGDTLSQIAEMFDVTSNTILWANDIKNGVIQPGQSLVILPIVGVRHIVKDGDTLASVAKKYGADSDEILEYNQLASLDELGVGETLVIPGGEIAMQVHAATPKTYASSGGGSTGGGSSAGFVHPAPGAVRTQGIHGYNAVDLASRGGAYIPIRAAAAGQVIVSKSGGWNGGYGNYIVIKHNDGTQTLYAHLSSNSVGVGAWVGTGETIGAMGNSGKSTGTHLHFEVRGASNPF